MTHWTLVTRSLRFYWRTHLGVLLGAAVGTAILVGALVVGDSVRHTLRELALLRLGDVHLAMSTSDRFFRAALAPVVSKELNAPVATALQLRGLAIHNEANARANRVQVVGVNENFWALAPDGVPSAQANPSDDSVVLNARLADQLSAEVGSTILLRLERPSLLPRDAPLSTTEDLSVAMRLRVSAIASDRMFGRFSLFANQVAPLTAFVSLDQLQKRIGRDGRANLMLVGARGSPPTVDMADTALKKVWQLADAGLELRDMGDRGVTELRTDRVFLDPDVATAARQLPSATGILTYFVNRLAHGQNQTPYSMVAALEMSGLLPIDMSEDEIVVNQWTAEDLNVSVGDVIDLSYYVMGSMRKLEERTKAFRVRAVVPIEGEAADQALMPAFPGLAEREHCRDWEPGFTIELDAIREQDEAYWTRYRGTPKGFITLSAGQRIWNNRFGDLTAIRFPLANTTSDAIRVALRQAIDPPKLGFFFQPVHEQALSASAKGQDFGSLFLGFSFFLIIAALLLMGMLFTFGVEQRTEEVGTLLALGYGVSRVRRLLLGEGLAIAIVGSLIGTALGLLYTKFVLIGLSTVWLKAVGSSSLQLTISPKTLFIGGLAGAIVALLTIGFTTYRQARRPARELLVADVTGVPAMQHAEPRSPRWSLWLTGIAGLGAVVLTLWGLANDVPPIGLFFGAGALLLVTCLGLSQALLNRLRQVGRSVLSLGGLGVRGVARRRGRSLATVCLLACGCFMIIAVDSFRHHPKEGQQPIESGTGGFALIGESTLPVHHDLSNATGQEALGLEARQLNGLEVLPFRVRAGDDASCLNLNRAQQPRLLGVDSKRLHARGAFTFIKTVDGSTGRDAWGLLAKETDDNVVAAIGDQATVYWALGRNVGDTLDYVDEKGNTFKLRIVGMTSNTLLQGSLLIEESAFVERFPTASGYQLFLIDVPSNADTKEISRALARGLRDSGLDLTSASERMAIYDEVENTYLSIFQALGGLGLILGSVGLGIVVMRNVLERRGELALFRAVGFRRKTVQWLVMTEHWLLLALGLVCGVVSAAVAVLPALSQPGQAIPYKELSVTLLAVVVSGALWTYLAARAALRGNLLNALRNE